MKKIADILTSAGIPSPLGGDWKVSTIETILKNPVYTGNLKWNIHKGEESENHIFPNSHPAIIPIETIDLIQLNQQLQKQFGRLDTPFLMLNKLQCQECGQYLQAKNNSTNRNDKTYHYRYYICPSCSYKLKAKDVHEVAIEQIKSTLQQLLSSDDLKSQVLSCTTDTLQSIESEIESIDEQLSFLEMKSNQAKKYNDHEFLNRLSSRLDDLLKSRSVLENKEIIANSLIQDIQDGSFFKRFELVSSHTLHNHELRLLCLYFVDKMVVSKTMEPRFITNWDMLKNVFSQDDG